MKNQGLIIGGLVLGGAVLLFALSSSQKKLLASTNATSVAGVGGLLSGVGSFLKSIGGSGPPAAYGSISTPNNNNSSPVDTATSNYLADATASADTDSGVIGFGGWDD